MFNYLNTNNIISNECEIFHNGVRDDNSINVLKCKKTGTLFLDKIIILENQILLTRETLHRITIVMQTT